VLLAGLLGSCVVLGKFSIRSRVQFWLFCMGHVGLVEETPVPTPGQAEGAVAEAEHNAPHQQKRATPKNAPPTQNKNSYNHQNTNTNTQHGKPTKTLLNPKQC